MKAKVFTASNYRGLNEQWLPVKEMAGTRVSCAVKTEFGEQTVDFALSEILELDYSEKEAGKGYLSAELEPMRIQNPGFGSGETSAVAAWVGVKASPF